MGNPFIIPAVPDPQITGNPNVRRGYSGNSPSIYMKKILIILIILIIGFWFFGYEKVTPLGKQNRETAYVVKVVDGDTIRVLLNGNKKTIRMLGVDTPETVHPFKEVECYGPEASNASKGTLSNQKVYLSSDSLNSDKDKYGRLLRYVYLEDGSLFNKYLIENGYARYYDKKIQFTDEFKALENRAKENKTGLWGKCY